MRTDWTRLLRKKRVWIALVSAAVLLYILSRAADGPARRGPQELTYKVRKRTLVIDMVETGSLKAKKSTPIFADIQRQATILHIVDEGSHVKEGEILVELDKSDLEKSLDSALISLEQATDDVDQKEKALEIQEIQNESALAKAELKVELGHMDMEKYEQGEGPQKIKEARASMKKAERDMQGMPELLEKGFVTQNELLDAEVALDKAQMGYEVLMKYTHPKNLKKNRSDHEEAQRELKATETRLASVMAQKESALNRSRRQLELRKDAVDKLHKDIEAMTLKAPNDGIVIYGTGDPRARRRGQEIDVGTRVSGRQTIITLPDMSVMQVACEVHEIDVDKIKVGQDVDVRMDAYPDLMVSGRVEKVGQMARQTGRWWMSDVKVFDVEVVLESNDPRLKPGMSARVTIHIDRLDDVLTAPVDAIFEEERQYYCYVLQSRTRKRVKVTPGKSNDSFVAITDGLEEGDVVVLAPGGLDGEGL